MGNTNLPPGCSESDLPGWHDVETTLTIDCPTCGPWEAFLAVDERGTWVHEDCPTCGQNVTTWYSGDWWAERD